MDTTASELRWIRAHLRAKAHELTLLAERLPPEWQPTVGDALRGIAADARGLARSIEHVLEVSPAQRPSDPDAPIDPGLHG